MKFRAEIRRGLSALPVSVRSSCVKTSLKLRSMSHLLLSHHAPLPPPHTQSVAVITVRAAVVAAFAAAAATVAVAILFVHSHWLHQHALPSQTRCFAREWCLRLWLPIFTVKKPRVINAFLSFRNAFLNSRALHANNG